MKRGWQWPVLVTAALMFTVGVNVVMLVAATADPNGTVVEPDYYRKAVDWDRTMARRAASAALGWRATATLGALDGATRPLSVTLVDAAGTPVLADEVHATLIHNRKASTPRELTLRRDDAGTYRVDAPERLAGLWELRISARRGDERFIATTHVNAP